MKRLVIGAWRFAQGQGCGVARRAKKGLVQRATSPATYARDYAATWRNSPGCRSFPGLSFMAVSPPGWQTHPQPMAGHRRSLTLSRFMRRRPGARDFSGHPSYLLRSVWEGLQALVSHLEMAEVTAKATRSDVTNPRRDYYSGIRSNQSLPPPIPSIIPSSSGP